MPEYLQVSSVSARLQFEKAARLYNDTVARHLPVHSNGSPWRSNGPLPPKLPRQGWKLHVSATILTATEILEIVAPILREKEAHCKGIASLGELFRLNSGLIYGYSQIGKFLTIYPQSDAAACRIAHRLAEATSGADGPMVPFEVPVADGSPVFARYGVFSFGETQTGNTGLRAPNGEFEADRRDRNPSWARAPKKLFKARARPECGPLARTFRAYEALAQRGKGGVYRAVDLSVSPPRRCVLKEGRRFGETGVDGSDGRSRLVHESKVMRDLERAGIPVAKTYAHFEEGGNCYIAIEWIEGSCLATMVSPGQPRLPLARGLVLSVEAAHLLAAIHHLGWVWRDLKPANLILSTDGSRLRPLDFEGSARIDADVTSAWGSVGFMPKDALTSATASKSQDVYALGVLIHQLLSDRTLPAAHNDVQRRRLTSDVPSEVDRLIENLTADNSSARPTAEYAARKLTSLLQQLETPSA